MEIHEHHTYVPSGPPICCADPQETINDQTHHRLSSLHQDLLMQMLQYKSVEFMDHESCWKSLRFSCADADAVMKAEIGDMEFDGGRKSCHRGEDESRDETSPTGQCESCH